MNNPINPIIDKSAPDFVGQSTQGIIQLSKFKGQPVILYFYPKDHTPGCTIESCNFRDNFQQFAKLNATVIGISRDSLKSHEKFQEKYRLPFPLVTDPEGQICEIYQVLKNKTLFGVSRKGIERSTFLIDAHGILRQEWRKVKVLGHVKAVHKALENLSSRGNL